MQLHDKVTLLWTVNLQDDFVIYLEAHYMRK
jgi:hypothetical protein